MMGRLQFWLQGHPNKDRPWLAIWVGNRISDLRFWWWRRTNPASIPPKPSEGGQLERALTKRLVSEK